MKKVLFSIGLAFLAFNAFGQARIQVIHNCADAAASTVDIYVNGNLLIGNVNFRTASAFTTVPSGVPISIQVAPGASTSAAQAIYTQPTVTLMANAKYIIVADGIVSATGYAPATPFNLEIYPTARETSLNPANTDVLVHHGCTDAPAVDVIEYTAPAGTIVDNASYPDFTSYLELAPADYGLNVTPAAGFPVLASYNAPLATLGLQGQALTVLASGFLNPAVNSNGPAFGLYVALAAGGPLIALPTATAPTARVQVIHNSADAGAAVVDVYNNGAILINDFNFRTASPFVTLPAGMTVNLQVAPDTSTSAAQAIASFPVILGKDKKYIVVADGIVSPTGYAPATPFNLEIYPSAREVSVDPMKTDVLVHHGCTDAPAVDVLEYIVPAGTIVNDISYPQFNPYLELTTANYGLNVTPASGTPVLASYSAPLLALGLQGKAITVLASGFLNPAVNSGGPAFGLWAALATGGPLVDLSSTLSLEDLVGTSFSIFPNPASDKLNFSAELKSAQTVTYSITDLSGKIMVAKTIENVKNLNESIDLAGLASGTYTLNIQNESGITAKMFVVTK